MPRVHAFDALQRRGSELGGVDAQALVQARDGASCGTTADAGGTLHRIGDLDA